MNNIIEQAKELNRRLTNLLDDPQPGLISWCICFHETLVSLGKLSGTNKVAGVDSVNNKKD
jgi:hypothetical protein